MTRTKNLRIRNESYDDLTDKFPDSVQFLNHGAAPRSGKVRIHWLKPEDRIYRYYVHLLRLLVGRSRTRGLRILDVGSGRGGNSRILAEYLGAKEVVGLDLSSGNVRFCRKHHALRNLKFVRGDAQKLPFAENTFDLVLNTASTYLYKDVLASYREALRVLRPGGIFCHGDVLAPSRIEARTQLLRGAGFARIQSRDLTEESIAGIAANRELLKKMVMQGGSGRVETAMGLVHGINVVGLKKYSSGRMCFHAWRARKPGHG